MAGKAWLARTWASANIQHYIEALYSDMKISSYIVSEFSDAESMFLNIESMPEISALLE